MVNLKRKKATGSMMRHGDQILDVSRTLHVVNLDTRVTPLALVKVCEMIGPLSSVAIKCGDVNEPGIRSTSDINSRPMGVAKAYAIFINPNDLHLAVKSLNTVSFYNVPIKVDYVRCPDEYKRDLDSQKVKIYPVRQQLIVGNRMFAAVSPNYMQPWMLMPNCPVRPLPSINNSNVHLQTVRPALPVFPGFLYRKQFYAPVNMASNVYPHAAGRFPTQPMAFIPPGALNNIAPVPWEINNRGCSGVIPTEAIKYRGTPSSDLDQSMPNSERNSSRSDSWRSTDTPTSLSNSEQLIIQVGHSYRDSPAMMESSAELPSAFFMDPDDEGALINICSLVQQDYEKNGDQVVENSFASAADESRRCASLRYFDPELDVADITFTGFDVPVSTPFPHVFGQIGTSMENYNISQAIPCNGAESIMGNLCHLTEIKGQHRDCGSIGSPVPAAQCELTDSVVEVRNEENPPDFGTFGSIGTPMQNPVPSVVKETLVAKPTSPAKLIDLWWRSQCVLPASPDIRSNGTEMENLSGRGSYGPISPDDRRCCSSSPFSSNTSTPSNCQSPAPEKQYNHMKK